MTDEESVQPPAPEPVSQPPEVPFPVTIESPDSAQTKAVPSEPIKEPLANAKPLDEDQSETAQISVNEPMPSEQEPIVPPLEPITRAPEQPPAVSIARSEPSPPAQGAPPTAAPSIDISRDLLKKARLEMQERKRKKLGKIMEVLNVKGKITNDEVEKLLHVSDATATRYLSLLEKEGKVKQVGKTGTGVAYAKVI